MEYFLIIVMIISVTLLVFGIESLKAPYTTARLIQTATIVLLQIICTGGIYGVTKNIMTPLYSKIIVTESIILILLIMIFCRVIWKCRK